MKTLKVFFNQKQQVNSNTSFSPSAGKPLKVLREWQKLRPDMIEVIESKSCSPAQIALAHNIDYVHGVLSTKIANGFGNKNKEVASSLRYTTGSLVSAAFHAIRNKEVTASLTSGFHHACYNNGGEFCTFNGLVIAAQMLRLHGQLKKGRIGILDLDQHYGNGTDDIIKKLNLDYIDHWTLGLEESKFGKDKKAIFKDIERMFKQKFKNCDLVIVQLGADACENDPLGHTFSIEEMQKRDRLVMALLKKFNIPAVFNLAGGYQEDFQKVLDLHNISLLAWEENFRGE